MMRIKSILAGLLLFSVFAAQAADVETVGNQITIRPKGGQARVIRLEVVSDNIIRVRATSKDELPQKPASLMIVPQKPYKGSVTVTEHDAETDDLTMPARVVVKAKDVQAQVSKETGRIEFYDGKGQRLLEEVYDCKGEEPGKQFWDFTVPERELGMKTGVTVPEEQKHGLTWQMKFQIPSGSQVLYGLGQHQSEEFNMLGKNEDLFQYNTKVSMACPVGYYKARNRSVYFPRQCGWYNLYTGEKVIDGETSSLKSHISSRRLVVAAPYEQIPVFVPEGAIIPFGPQMQWSDEKAPELINLYIYAGQDGEFQLYEDEGTNYNYEKGLYSTIDITYDDASKSVSFGQRKGHYPGMLKNRRFNVVLITKDTPQPLNLENPKGTIVNYNGKAVSRIALPQY